MMLEPEDVLHGIAMRAVKFFEQIPGVEIAYGTEDVRVSLTEHSFLAPSPAYWMNPMKGLDTIDCYLAAVAGELADILYQAAVELNALAMSHRHDDGPDWVTV
jgi:hypothetical protein